ncbi:unnamed protein product [Prunus brigantina]
MRRLLISSKTLARMCLLILTKVIYVSDVNDNEYHRNIWHVRWAGFRFKHFFDTLWSFLLAVAAVVLLLLTAIQAFFAVYDYFKGGGGIRNSGESGGYSCWFFFSLSQSFVRKFTMCVEYYLLLFIYLFI